MPCTNGNNMSKSKQKRLNDRAKRVVKEKLDYMLWWKRVQLEAVRTVRDMKDKW